MQNFFSILDFIIRLSFLARKVEQWRGSKNTGSAIRRSTEVRKGEIWEMKGRARGAVGEGQVGEIRNREMMGS